ncbi:MAG: elongation factor Ts [Chloroflexi bacterium]|nr:elongation factor Ts [Chloroflexota bacterium]
MLKVTAEMIKEVRGQTGAGVMDCRNALLKAEGDLQKALQLLKEQNLITVEKKAKRATTQGVIDCYVHTGERIGAMVELNCETDFVARTCEFRELAHNLAMQVAALEPKYVSEADIPAGADIDPKAACLLLQPYIREPTKTIQDIVAETIAKTGENIRVKKFVRFEIGSET